MGKKTLQLEYSYKPRQVFEGLLIVHNEKRNEYGVYSLEESKQVEIPFLHPEVPWKEFECKDNIGVIFTAISFKAKDGEKIQCLVLSHSGELLRGRYGSDIFDCIEVIGDKIHTTVRTKQHERLEQWFDAQGNILLYITQNTKDELYKVYASDKYDTRICDDACNTEAILDEKGNINGIAIYHFEDKARMPVEYYKF